MNAKPSARSFLYKTAAAIMIVMFALTALPVKPAYADACTFTASGAGNWSNPAIWSVTGSGCGTYPGSTSTGDIVNIIAGYTVTLDVTPANSIASLQLGATTATGGIADGTLTFGGAFSLSVIGNVAVGGADSVDRAGTINFVSGSTLTADSVTLGGGALNPPGTMTMTAGSTLNTGSFALGAGTGAKTWTPSTGTVIMTATNTLPASVFTTFGNLTFNGGTTTAGAGLTIAGNALISTDAVFAGGTFNHSVAGNWTNNGAADAFTSAGTVTFNGGSGTTQTLSGNTTFYNLTLDNTGATTSFGASATTIANTLTATAGTMNGGTSTIIFTGASGSIAGTNAKNFYNLQIDSGASISNSTGIGNITINNNFTNNGTFTQAAARTTYFGGTTQNLSGTGATTFGIFTIQGTSTTNAGSHNFNVAGATFTATGTFTPGTSTVTFNGTGAQTISRASASQTFYNVVIAKTAGQLLNTGGSITTLTVNNLTETTGNFTAPAALNINGNLNISSGTFTTAGVITVAGTTTVGTGASLMISATGTKIFTGLVTINNGATWNSATGNPAVTFRGGITNNNTFTAGSGVFTFDTNNQALTGIFSINNVTVTDVTLTNNGTLTVNQALSGTGGLTQVASSTLYLRGTSDIATLTASNSGNTVIFDGLGAQAVNAANYYNLTISGSRGGNITLPNGGTIGVAGTFTPSASFVTGAFVIANNTILFNGTGGSQSIYNFTFNNFTLDNTSGATLTGNATTINGALTFTNGKITTGIYHLNLPITATVSGAGAGKYIYGTVVRDFTAAATSFSFPVGDASVYAPVDISFTALGTGGNVTVKTTAGEHGSIATSNINASKSVNRYWTLTPSGIADYTYDATFNFVAGDVDAGADTGIFIVGKNNAGTWSYPTVGTKNSTNTQATGMTLMSDFAIGDIITQTLTYTAGANGTITAPPASPTTHDRGASVPITAVPATGYHFVNWTGNVSTIDNVNAASATITMNGNYAITANFAITSYTISFNSNGGSDVTAITQNFGTTVTTPTAPTQTDYTFDGWYSDTELTAAYTFTTMPAENITLYAKWTADTYTVTFDSKEGSAVSPITDIAYNATVTLPAPPTKALNTFDGWFSDDTTFLVPFTASTNVTANITVYAKWTVDTYTVTFDSKEGSGVSPITDIAYNATVTLPAPPTKALNTFDGWFSDDTTFLVPFTASTNVTANITVYAKWTADTYTVTFDSKEGSVVSPITDIAYNATVTLPVPPTKALNTFGGWFSDDTTFLVPFTASTNVTANITVYAKWTADTYTVAFDSKEGSAVSPITDIAYNATVTLPEPPTKALNTFGGWFSDDTTFLVPFTASTNVIANITIYAKWTSTYTLTYTAGANGSITGDSPQTITSGENGTTVTAVANPGYHFVDWSDGVLTASRTDTNVLANVSVTANFAINTTVTYYSSGSYDGWILETGEKTSKGGALDSKSTTFRLGDDKAKKQYRGILSFSTKGLPDTATITKVTLKVRKQGIVGGGNPVTIFKGFMVDIKKGTFGTSALQITDFQTPATKTYGPFKTALSGSWYNIDLTSGQASINKLATSSGLTQIRLRFYLDDNNNGIANYLSLYSGDMTNAAYRPQLVVEYYEP